MTTDFDFDFDFGRFVTGRLFGSGVGIEHICFILCEYATARRDTSAAQQSLLYHAYHTCAYGKINRWMLVWCGLYPESSSARRSAGI